MTDTSTARGGLRLATRASKLARVQADWVAAQLRERGVRVDIVEVTTQGDAESGQPLVSIGGQGLFTKQIQQALLADLADLAVHSLKDLPTAAVPGLMLAAVPPREDPADVLVARAAASFDELSPGAKVGTGSPRRQAQLLHARSDLRVEGVRGNVETRLRKLDEGQYDALILARAGLARLGLEERITQELPPQIMLPAVGQGALGIECRADDEAARAVLDEIDDPSARAEVTAERAMMFRLQCGCLAPVAARARCEDDKLHLAAAVLTPDGRERLFHEEWTDAMNLGAAAVSAESLGHRVAEALLAQGAARLIAAAAKEDR